MQLERIFHGVVYFYLIKFLVYFESYTKLPLLVAMSVVLSESNFTYYYTGDGECKVIITCGLNGYNSENKPPVEKD